MSEKNDAHFVPAAIIQQQNTPSVHELLLYDRTRSTTDWSCPRKRYWNYEFGGRGVVPESTDFYLYMGTAIHDALAAIAFQHKEGGIDIDAIADAARKHMYDSIANQITSGDTGDEFETIVFAKEQSTLVEGLVRGFHKAVWPALIAEYPEILLIEQELTYDHDGIRFMSKPDLVLGRDGDAFYIEYKSTMSKKDKWINSWNTAVQVHSSIKAIEAKLGQPVAAVIVQGLYKGYESYGKQSSPFCYGYARSAQPPFISGEVRYDYAPGFKRAPVWEMEGGVREWVANMPDNTLVEQFPRTAPIFINEDLVNAFFNQRAIREREIQMGMFLIEGTYEIDDKETRAAGLDAYFPQKFEQCYPAFGNPCAYRSLCFSNSDNPLALGYNWRESHHPMEAERHERKDRSIKEQEEGYGFGI
jgi:hypothetical protein